MASIYKRGETWWITYRIGGKNICHSLDTNVAREAAEMKRLYEAKKTNGLIRKPSSTPIGPFLQDLCDYWRKTHEAKSAETDIGRLRGIFGQCCKALEFRSHTAHRFRDQAEVVKSRGQCLFVKKLEDVTADAIRSHLQHRFMSGEIGGKTANRIRAVLSSMFAYAKEHHGYVCPEPDFKYPVEAVKRFDEVHPPIVWLKADQITQQLDALAENPAIRAMVATYIYAGLRRSEGLWLTRDDVDLQKRVIRVCAKEIDGKEWRPKTRKNRTVPISSQLLKELTTYVPMPKSVWFFPVRSGGRWDADYFSEVLRIINHTKGLPWSCIEYRHTFGSHLAQKGISLYKISELMGNSPEICRKHYAALMPQEMHEEVEFEF